MYAKHALEQGNLDWWAMAASNLISGVHAEQPAVITTPYSTVALSANWSILARHTEQPSRHTEQPSLFLCTCGFLQVLHHLGKYTSTQTCLIQR